MDLGAEESFARAAQRVGEHYGVVVATSRVRRHTLAHGAQMSAQVVLAPKTSVATLVTQMDGSLIPIVTVAARGDLRRASLFATSIPRRAGLAIYFRRLLRHSRNNCQT